MQLSHPVNYLPCKHYKSFSHFFPPKTLHWLCIQTTNRRMSARQQTPIVAFLKKSSCSSRKWKKQKNENKTVTRTSWSALLLLCRGVSVLVRLCDVLPQDQVHWMHSATGVMRTWIGTFYINIANKVYTSGDLENSTTTTSCSRTSEKYL